MEDKDDRVYRILEGYTKSGLVSFLVDILSEDAKDEIITNYESQESL